MTGADPDMAKIAKLYRHQSGNLAKGCSEDKADIRRECELL